jgi:transposase
MTTIAEKLAQIKSDTLLVGLDLGLESITVVVLDANGRRVDRFMTSQNREGYEYLAGRLRRVVTKQGACGLLAGMEPTNYYWKQVGTFLSQEQLRFRLVNPLTVNRHREGDQLDRSKDDWRDAFMIADLLRTGKFTETELRTGGYAELQIGHATYWRLRHDRGRQLTLVTNALRQVFPELQQVFKDLTGQTAQALLHSVPAAAQIRAMSCSDFIARVRQAADGHRLAVTCLRQAYGLAQQSIGLTEGLETLCFDLQNSLRTVSLLDQQTQDLLSILLRQFWALPEAPYLSSIQGLWETSAMGLLAETGDLSCYHTIKSLTKLAGTQPTFKESGHYHRSLTPFSKQGRSRLRMVLFWATLHLLRHNDAIGYHYQRLQTRKQRPLEKMEALGACMNKLLAYVWATGHNQVPYTPELWRSLA